MSGLAPDPDAIPPIIRGVHELLMEVSRAVYGGFPFLALMGALTIPDVMAALEAEDGATSKERYIAWFAANLPRTGDSQLWGGRLKAEECYRLRCTMLHQARTGHLCYERVLFTDPTSTVYSHGNIFGVAGKRYLNISLDAFCARMTEAGLQWLWDHWQEPTVSRNLESSIRRHKGLEPVADGIDFIG